MCSTWFHHGTPQGTQTLVSWWYGYGASGVHYGHCLGYPNPSWRLMYWRLVCEASWFIQILWLKEYASWNPIHGGYGPKVPYSLTFHMDSLLNLISTDPSCFMMLDSLAWLNFIQRPLIHGSFLSSWFWFPSLCLWTLILV